jgi:hypothetical protein
VAVEDSAASVPEGAEVLPRGFEREGRALLGWMTPEEGSLVLASRQVDEAQRPEYREQVERARERARGRAAGLDQTDVLHDVPDDLGDHVATLRANDSARPMFEEGWGVVLADLRRVIAVQPTIFVDHARERLRGVDVANVRDVAAVTLPLPARVELPAQFDSVRQAWMLTSPNPNLRIVGNFGGEISPGVTGFGFAVRVLPSFMQVAEFEGKLLLRDGYHRAYGLLADGAELVPVFTRQFQSIEELGFSPGMLPQVEYLGERPPTLQDYLNDEVAADVRLPAWEKMIVIHGMELTPLG